MTGNMYSTPSKQQHNGRLDDDMTAESNYSSGESEDDDGPFYTVDLEEDSSAITALEPVDVGTTSRAWSTSIMGASCRTGIERTPTIPATASSPPSVRSLRKRWGRRFSVRHMSSKEQNC